MQNLMQICCSTCSFILECNGHTVHVLTQQVASTTPTDYYSEVVIVHTCAVHSPWLPGYIDVAQTVLIILTMAGLFLDRPHRLKAFHSSFVTKYVLSALVCQEPARC